jgi:ribokinase
VRASLQNSLPAAGCVLVSTEIPPAAVTAAVEAAAAAGVPCILNTAPVVPVVAELLRLGPIVTPNSTELAAVSEVLGRSPGSIDDAAAHIATVSGHAVVVTLGSEGVMVVQPDGAVQRVPAPVVEARDTTGAGDTFNGVLAARLAHGDSLADAVQVAVVAASISVTQAGARCGMPTAAEIEVARR